MQLQNKVGKQHISVYPIITKQRESILLHHQTTHLDNAFIIKN